MNPFKRLISIVLILSTTLLGMPRLAHAGMVSTEDAISTQTAQVQRADVLAFLSREDVRAALEQQGVSRESALTRVDAMTDSEVAQLAQNINQAPAGGDVLGTLLFVFVLLLVTDILGLTKVYPFTRAVR